MTDVASDRLYRAAAGLALASAGAALVVMCVAVRAHPWSMPGILVALPAAVVAGWHVVSRRGLARVVAALVALAAIAIPVLHVLAHQPGALVVTMALLAFSMASARLALLPTGRRSRGPRHPRGAPVTATRGRRVLLVNPTSGRATGADLALTELARREAVDLVAVRPGDDLGELAEVAVRDGAAVLGVAGGDGSVAPVAAVAARHGLPFVCVPSGTRNHFALDLGLNRNDLPHAMSAFHRGVPCRTDLATVNGRVFVNNVSLGLYGALVGSPHYRRCKLRAVLDELPDVIGPQSAPLPLRFATPDGVQQAGVHAMLISNSPYRLGALGGSAWRPSLDSGSLGVLTVRVDGGRAVARLALLNLIGRGHLSPGLLRWSTGSLTVDADGPLLAGVDGEPVTLRPPLRFRIVPSSLVVRLPVPQRRRSPRRLVTEARQLIRTFAAGSRR